MTAASASEAASSASDDNEGISDANEARIVLIPDDFERHRASKNGEDLLHLAVRAVFVVKV
jgi:hypothetical protein